MVMILRLIGIPMIIGGLTCYALMKGTWALGLLDLLSCPGLLLLAFLPKRCHHFRRTASYRTRECPECGAPM